MYYYMSSAAITLNASANAKGLMQLVPGEEMLINISFGISQITVCKATGVE